MLTEAVNNFQSGLEEIIFAVRRGASVNLLRGCLPSSWFRVRLAISGEPFTRCDRLDVVEVSNYADAVLDAERVGTLRTRLSLSPNEFHAYDIAHDASLTFCLKELKAVAAFCDFTEQVVLRLLPFALRAPPPVRCVPALGPEGFFSVDIRLNP